MTSLDYMTRIRRQLHSYPEIGFALPRSVALVKRELDDMGIPYTEKYGTSSIVADMGDLDADYTIAIRADMDALPICEDNDVEYKSLIDGRMHACGHDAHTAILLGVARELRDIGDDLSCRVRLIFQASEEGPDSGAERMVRDGVMDGVDIIVALHVDGWTEVGKVGVCIGDSMASQRSFKIEFFGASAHATLAETGRDALSAAAFTYTNIRTLIPREVTGAYVCHIGKLCGGETQNVVADYAEILGTIRTFDMKVDQYIIDRISEISSQTASEYGVEVKVTSIFNMFNLYNDPYLSERLIRSAKAVVGEDNIVDISPKMSSEDFSQYLTVCSGVLFRLGTRNEAKGITSLPHNSDFDIDEASLEIGRDVFVRFILDMAKER